MKRRSNCPVNCALEVFGDRWTLIIMRDMLIYKKRNYKEFLESTEGISTNILAARLMLLVENEIIFKKRDSQNGLKFIYEPTQKGKDLFPVLLEMAKWSKAHIPGVNWMNVE